MKKILLISGLLISVITSVFAFTVRDAQVYAASVGSYQMISLDIGGSGQGGNAHSGPYAVMTADGNFVVFSSKASNLVANDTNGVSDIFLRNLKDNTTSLVSLSSTGAQVDVDDVALGAVSKTGRYIVFSTKSTTLEAGPSNTIWRTYLHDNVTGSNRLISSIQALGVRAISSDGRLVVAEYTAGSTGKRQYVYDANADAWTRIAMPVDGVDPNNKHQILSSMSCDGSSVVFKSSQANLTTVDNNGSLMDIFLSDLRVGGGITNITHTFNQPSDEPIISCNGDYVVFSTPATNVVSGLSLSPGKHYYRYDVINKTFSLVDMDPYGFVLYQPTFWKLTDKGEVLFRAKQNTDPFSYTWYLRRDIDNQTFENITGSFIPVDSSSMDKDGKKFVTVSALTNLVTGDTNGFADVFTSQIN